MAASAMYPVSNDPTNKAVPSQLQRKILQDVFECIVQLKSEFFEHHQPITDDSVVLQRFCAKFEHLLQIGMRERTSIMGRRKDYWDYFCQCLGSARGSNDGIKYVKSLGENKTSLGRGRAFIRFCLVHQRLADTLQQCAVHDKTKDWFLPSSALMSPKDSQSLISSLYDLNSLHFDLAPRGYDLDTSWPSFANKSGSGSSWAVPISRRSSITSMDTISQISVSVEQTGETERLNRDLESVQAVRDDLIVQVNKLSEEKEKAGQSAWAAQGELQALQQQLSTVQCQHSELQERYKELDVSFVKLKMEKEHMEKVQSDQLKLLEGRCQEEEAKRVNSLKEEEEIWKQEVKDESDRKQREIDKLQADLGQREADCAGYKEEVAQIQNAVVEMLTQFEIPHSGTTSEAHLSSLAGYIRTRNDQLSALSGDKTSVQEFYQKELSDKNKEIGQLEGRIEELRNLARVSQESASGLQEQLTAASLEVHSEREKVQRLNEKELELTAAMEERQKHIETLQSELKVQRDDCEKLRDSKIDLEKQKLELEQRFGGLEANIVELKGQSEQTSKELMSMNEKCQEQEKEINKMKGEKEVDMIGIETKNEEIDDLQRSLEEKEAIVSDLKAQLESSSTTCNSLKSQLHEKSKAVEEMTSQLTGQEQSTDGLKRQLEDNLKQSEIAMKEREKMVEEAEEKLAAAQTQLDEVNTGAEKKQREIVELSDKLSKAEAELETVRAKNGDLEGAVLSLEKEKETMTRETQEKEEGRKIVESERDDVKVKLSACEEEVNNLTSKIECFKDAQAAKDNEIEEMKVKMSELRAESEKEKERMLGLLRDSENVRQSEGEKSEKLNGLIVAMEELRQSKDAEVAEKHEQILSLQDAVSSKDGEVNSLKMEVGQLKVEVEREVCEKSKLVSSHNVENDAAQKKEKEQEEKWTEELRLKDCQVELLISEISTKTDKIEGLKQRVSSTEKDLRKLKEDLSSRSSEIEALQGEALTKQKEFQDLKQTVSDRDGKIEQLTQEYNKQVEDLSEQVKKLKAETTVKENEDILGLSQMQELRASVAQLSSELSSQKSSHEESVSALNMSVSSATGERDLLAQQMNDALLDAQQIKSQLTETSEQLALTYSQLESVTSEKISLSAEVGAMSEELTRALNIKESSERKVKELEASLRSAEDEAQEKLSQKRGLEEELLRVEADLKRVSEEKAELEASARGKNEFSTQVLEESLTEAHAALEEARDEKSLLQGERDQLSHQVEELQGEINRLKDQTSELHTQLSSVENATQNNSSPEVESLKKQLEEQCEQHKSAVEDLNEEISALQFQLSSEQMNRHEISQPNEMGDGESDGLRARISDLEIIIEQLEEELSAARQGRETDSSQVQEMESRFKLKETECSRMKDQLQRMESVLTAEGNKRQVTEAELNSLRQSSQREKQDLETELAAVKSDNEQIKKKLIKLIKDKDDLWQRTDQLVDEQKRKATDRWQDNSMVTHCPQCNTEFSLFVRKHHCRLCGKIYCWACSDFWLDVAHSSKKARVCKSCFERHTDLDAMRQSMSTSMITGSSDEEEDEGQTTPDGVGTREGSHDSAVSPHNQTDEGKIRQSSRVNPAQLDPTEGAAGQVDDPDNPEEGMFQIVTEADVERSMSDYSNQQATDTPENMSTSMLLSAEDLLSGQVNSQNQVWIKPGRTFAVPISIPEENAALEWEFSSHPKDIVFTVNYKEDDSVALSEAEEIVAPCKCDSHKQTVHGELTTKKSGIYTLIFDNTYSRLTSKKVHYSLSYKKSSS
ncbi:FYVE and coiled-coil domain-containing protein 1 [Aplysia californica]|uniref:FYVE and coiled-coil domain-containing protein 1 n=1 Tax=Aplysia californica TaxID=6500 RepID=A0ABM0JYQ0_APLCA|nr:FYVE and coiled-coil domain-containing protein 1 [Aplysia californica]